MRTTPAAHPGTRRPSFEYRVRFTGRLVDAVLVPAEEVSVPQPRPAAPPSRTPTPASIPVPAPRVEPPAPTAPQNTRDADTDREHVEAALEQIRAGVAALREDQAGRLREWQRAAIELALTIATRLLHERIAAGEFPIEARVRDMIAQLEEDAPATVRLNPADLALLESRLGGEPLLSGRDDPRLVPDPELGRGECRVESRETILLSDLTRELQEIRDELLRSLGNARS
jgi:flagellar biosynthesis/type III secretory pathway protein FliH